MSTINYRFSDGHYEEIEVDEKLAITYAEMERSERLSERRETHRHQSLNKSMEHGWDIADSAADIYTIVEQHEQTDKLYRLINKLTDKQKTVFLLHVEEDKPFREIGEMLGLGTYTVRDYFYNAVKKLKNILT